MRFVAYFVRKPHHIHASEPNFLPLSFSPDRPTQPEDPTPTSAHINLKRWVERVIQDVEETPVAKVRGVTRLSVCIGVTRLGPPMVIPVIRN